MIEIETLKASFRESVGGASRYLVMDRITLEQIH